MSQEKSHLSEDRSEEVAVGNEYLTFRLGGEDYGVDILRVEEIRGYEAVTRIPNQPIHVKGVLNLRGSIVPIFDLRERLGMEPKGYNKETVVIVIATKDTVGERSLGVIVDEVSDVLHAEVNDIKNAPDFGGSIDTNYISGLASADDRMIMLLNADKLQSTRDLTSEKELETDAA